jgi:hypothetical protein
MHAGEQDISTLWIELEALSVVEQQESKDFG